MFTDHIYLVYMNKPDLALNNLQWLICPTKPNKNKPNESLKLSRDLPAHHVDG